MGRPRGATSRPGAVFRRRGVLRVLGGLGLLGLGLWGVKRYAVWAAVRGARGLGPASRENGGGSAGRGAQQNFVVFFSGHTGTSPFLDALGGWAEVLVPNFEPLEHSSLTEGDKLAYMETVWNLPSSRGRFPAWKRSLERHSESYKWMLDPPAVQDYDDVKGKTVAGFKMRPFVRSKRHRGEVEFIKTRRQIPPIFPWLERAAPDAHMYPGMLRLSPRELRRVFRRHNVTIVLMHREDRMAEALSWYRAREVGASQFTSEASREKGVFLNLDRFTEWMRFVESANRALEEAVKYFGRPTVVLLYEDFRKDPQAALEPLARHWGLKSAPAMSERFHKSGPSSLRDLVENFEELCSLLRGSEDFAHLDAGACDEP